MKTDIGNPSLTKLCNREGNSTQALSNTERDNSTQLKPTKGTKGSEHVCCFENTEKSSTAKLNTDELDPSWPKDRRRSGGSVFTSSDTNGNKPARTVPSTEIESARQAKFLRSTNKAI